MTSPPLLFDDHRTETQSAAPGRFARRLPDLIGIAVVCAVILLGYFEIPFAGKTFSTSSTVNGIYECRPPAACGRNAVSDPRYDRGASAWQTEPWGHVVHGIIADGESPLWNPYEGIGTPLAADPPAGAFDPLLLPWFLHPTPLMQDFTFSVLLMLVGVAAYWAGRILRLEPVAATVVGCVFGLSGWFFQYSNNAWFSTYIFLPLVVGCLEWTVRSTRLLPVVLLAASVAAMILTGMPEPTFTAIVGCAAYAVTRLFVGARVTSRTNCALRLGAGGLLAGLLAAPLWVPFLEYLPLSRNSRSDLSGVAPNTDPLHSLINWIMPRISPGKRGSYRLSMSGDYSYTRNWVGAGAVVLAVVGLSSRRAMRSHRGWPVFAMGAVIAVQVYFSPLSSLTRVIPVWSEVAWVRFGTPVLALAVAMLAGIGVQAVTESRVEVRRFAIGLGLVVAGVIAIALASPKPLAIGTDAIAGGWILALAITVAVVTTIVFARGRWRSFAIVGFVIIELLLLAPRGIYSPREDPYPRTGWVTFLQKAVTGDHSRIFSVDGLLFPNIAGAFELSDPRIVDALYIDRYWKYVKTFVSPGLGDRFTATGPTESAPAIADNPMFDLLGVRYLVFKRSSEGPPAYTAPQFRRVYQDKKVKIFENLDVMPRAFVVHDVESVDGSSAALRALRGDKQSTFPNGAVQVRARDMRRSAVVERAYSTPPVTESCSGNSDTARITKWSATSVTIRVRAECAGLLVLSDAYYPGWSAEVNGRESRIYPTDVALRGVEVPRGPSTVVYRFQPESIRIGYFLAGFGVIIIVGLTAFTRRFTRRRLKRRPVTR